MDRSCTYANPHNQLACTECGRDLSLCECVQPDDIAHERLTSPVGIVMAMIRGELDAVAHDDLHMLARLTAATGELSRLMIQHDEHQGPTTEEVLRSAVRVAAEAIRVAVQGDSNFVYMMPMQEEELPSGPVGRQYD